MATLFDSASLVMVPSGVKENKLYSIKPTDGSGDFTFSRGTDTATRVNSSGLIEKERGNTALYSNDFSNAAWSKTGSSSVTGGQSGYDGSNDAWLITDDGSNPSYAIYQLMSVSGVHTLSVYAKQASTSQLEIDMFDSTARYLRVELSDGSLHAQVGLIDYNVVNIGSGWWRVSLTFNASSTSYIRFGCNGAGTIYVQDLQLEQGLVAQPYIETTTAAVYEGITDNLPRLDYSGGASCPSLLLEPSRTNQITHSEYFNGADWINVDISYDYNATISPEGVQNATQLDFTGTTYKRFEQNTSNAETACTASIFMKYIDHAIVMARMDSTSGASYAWFNIQTGEVLKVDGATGSVPDPIASIDDYGDGWYRLNTTQTAMASNQEIFWYFVPDTDTSTGGWTGSGSAYVYGAQFEEGSYPTSYIPTYGTSASRAADDVNSLTSVSNLIGQTEGTIFIETSHIDEQAGDVRIQLSVGTSTNNWIFFGVPEATGGDYKARVYINNGGVNQVNRFGSALSVGNHKYALAYKENDVVLYVDGELQASDTLATIPACDRLTINGASPSSSASQAQNKYKQVALFKTRLTNAELAALTTI